MNEGYTFEPSANQTRRRIHIPFCDMDDLAFKNRSHDPAFIANITKMMQVPATITLDNQSPPNEQNKLDSDRNASFPMDIPEKLTTNEILNSRSNLNEFFNQANGAARRSITPNSTPTNRVNFIDDNADDDRFSKTPQIASELFNKFRPRRTSIEFDLNAEIRILRDKINNLEHECQVNSRSCRIFYAILCGYLLLKTFSWLIKN